MATVPVITPQRTTLERTSTQPANIRANFRAEIYAKVSGYLAELRADIGQRVAKDEVLGVVSVPEMQTSMETQQRMVERLVAEEQRAEAGIKLAQADLAASLRR